MMTIPDAPGEASASSGTGEGFIAFFDYLITRREMVEATAAALRTGCKKVLAVEDDLAALDMRVVDVDDIVRRFRNKSRGTMKDRSIEQYEQRFRQSVEMYRKWLDDDPDWLGARRAKASAGAGGSNVTRKMTTRAASANSAAASGSDKSSSQGLELVPAGMITYPLPLRPGLQARLLLPEDLSRSEAKRVMNFVSALAFDEQLALTASPSSDQ